MNKKSNSISTISYRVFGTFENTKKHYLDKVLQQEHIPFKNLINTLEFLYFWRHFRKKAPKMTKNALVFSVFRAWDCAEAQNLIKPVENWWFEGPSDGLLAGRLAKRASGLAKWRHDRIFFWARAK